MRQAKQWVPFHANQRVPYRESASDILNAYFQKHGGRDAIFEETEKATKTKKRGRASNGTPATKKRSRRNGTHPADKTPPATSKEWSPPAGSWEDEIETIDACEDEGIGKLVVYLIWKNGQKTKHDTQTIYKKCPQKVCCRLFLGSASIEATY
jgi:chromobox protein 1